MFAESGDKATVTITTQGSSFANVVILVMEKHVYKATTTRHCHAINILAQVGHRK